MTETTGHCHCGSVKFAFTKPQTWACHCHCNDCRRNCAAPLVTFIGTARDGFEWTGKTPKTYHSSPGVTRHFCDDCGTPMAFEATHYADEIHLYVATLTDPTDFTPEFHVHYDSKLPWLHIADDLDKHPGSAPDMA